MKEISLSKGKVALVDDADFERLVHYSWHHTNHGYAARKQGNKSFYMHREIMGSPLGLEVDHINGNKLDNRRENLRIVTSKQNRKNSGIRSDNVSGYKGVSWDRTKRKWRAHITLDGKNKLLGRFSDKNDAAQAYNEAAKKHFGQYARLNNIKEAAN